MTRKPRILVIGSFVMDLIASTARVPQSGQTVVGLSFRAAPGGKGANQAVQCARLGAEVTMVGCVGDDRFGQDMLECARASGTDVSHVKIAPGVTSGIGHVLLEVQGSRAQNRITVIPGANLALTVEDIAWLEQAIGTYDMLLLQLEVPLEVNLAAARWAAAAGVPVMLNPAPAAPLPEALLPYVTYLSPNEHEASAMTGIALHAESEGMDRAGLSQIMDCLSARGVRQMIITLGKSGAVWSGPRGVVNVPPATLPAVADPTGAGDSFVAAFCVGLTAGLPVEQALTFATHAAAITVSRVGAMPSLPTLDEVLAFLSERGFSAVSAAARAGLR